MRWFDLKESFRMSRIAGTYGVKKNEGKSLHGTCRNVRMCKNHPALVQLRGHSNSDRGRREGISMQDHFIGMVPYSPGKLLRMKYPKVP